MMGLEGYVTEIFGEYANDVLSLLPLASMGNGSAGTVSMAINNAENIYKGENPVGLAEYYNYVSDFLEGKGIKSDKMYNFFKALMGDKDAVAVDMHVWSIIMGKDPNKKQVNPANKKQFSEAKEFVKTLADELNLSPREVQASLWAANILRTGGKPDSYEQYFEKHIKQKDLENRIEGWRNQGYKPFSEIRRAKQKERGLDLRFSKAGIDVSQNTLFENVQLGRDAGIADSVIKAVLKSRGFKVADITKAMEIEVDALKMLPEAFRAIGAAQGLQLFNRVEDGLRKFTAPPKTRAESQASKVKRANELKKNNPELKNLSVEQIIAKYPKDVKEFVEKTSAEIREKAIELLINDPACSRSSRSRLRKK
jgi:hypothetical protein